MRFYTLNEIELARTLTLKKLTDWQAKWFSPSTSLELVSLEQKIFNEDVSNLKSLDDSTEMALKSEIIFGDSLDLKQDAQLFIANTWTDVLADLSNIFDVKNDCLGVRNETLLVVSFCINTELFIMGISEALAEKMCPVTPDHEAKPIIGLSGLMNKKSVELVISTHSKKVTFKEICTLKSGSVICLNHSVKTPFLVANSEGKNIAAAYLARSDEQKVILLEK